MSDATLAALLAWARAEGAYISESLEVRSGTRGRGVFAKRPVKQGEQLLELPASLSVQPSGRSERLAELCKAGKCSNALALVLTILHETHAASPRSPYFEDLAAAPAPGVPLLWPQGDAVLLAGTSLMLGASGGGDGECARAALEASAGAQGASFRDDVLPVMEALGPEFLPQAARSVDNFRRALAFVMSRGLRGLISYEVGDAVFWPCLRADGPPGKAEGPFLLPVVDLVNHSSQEAERCTALARGEQGAWEMRAARDVAAGEEILMSYGAHGTSELVRTYGFAEAARSPHAMLIFSHEEVMKAAVASSAPARRPPSCLRVARARFEAMGSGGWLPSAFLLRAGAPIPQQLISAAQVLVMSKRELREWREAGGLLLGADFLVEESLPGVVGCLLRLAEDRLAKLPPTAEHAAEGGATSGAAAMCRALAAEERHLLSGFRAVALSLCAASDDDEGDEEEEDDEGQEEDEALEEDEEDGEDEAASSAGRQHQPEEQPGRGLKRGREES